MKIKANGISINYALNGQGPCLVLIHGFSDNMTMWFNQVPVFSKRYQVLTYDVRGHGHTETPKGNFSMDLFAEDLNGLMTELKIEKACVLGYSMGGRIGLEFALKYPQKITGIVFANSGVAAPDAQPSPKEMEEMMKRRQEMMAIFESGNIETISEVMTERSMSPGFKEKAPDIFNRYKLLKMQNNPANYQGIMQAMASGMTSPPDLTKLTCPALIIAGEHDGFMAVSAVESMKKAIKNATAVIFPTGHAAAIEAPEDFNKAVLDFMAKLPN